MSAAPALPCACGISASLHVSYADGLICGVSPPHHEVFRFGESTQSHFAPRLTCRDALMPRADGSARAAFAPTHENTYRGTSDFDCLSGSVDGTSDLHGWRKCKGLSGTILALCRRRTPACGAPLSLLSLASPGLAIRGEPVRRDKGPLDLYLYPLHPPGPTRGSGMYRDVRVPRVQDAYERPSPALILGSTEGAKTPTAFAARG